MSLRPATTNEFGGLTIEEAKRRIASYSQQEISEKISEADRRSRYIELDEGYQLRISRLFLEQPYPPYNPNK